MNLNLYFPDSGRRCRWDHREPREDWPRPRLYQEYKDYSENKDGVGGFLCLRLSGFLTTFDVIHETFCDHYHLKKMSDEHSHKSYQWFDLFVDFSEYFYQYQ